MTENSPKVKFSKKKYIAVGVGIAISAIVGVLLLVVASSAGSGYSVEIVNDSFGVGARGYEVYPFSVPTDATNIKVLGTFSARGGSGNDITVMIVDEEEYTNYRSGHAPWTYYLSEVRSAGNIDVSLPSGKQYYLVFDNTFSTLSNKQVDAEVELMYTS